MRTVGLETGFSLRLADGTPELRGLCVVQGSYCDGDNAFQAPGRAARDPQAHARQRAGVRAHFIKTASASPTVSSPTTMNSAGAAA